MASVFRKISISLSLAIELRIDVILRHISSQTSKENKKAPFYHQKVIKIQCSLFFQPFSTLIYNLSAITDRALLLLIHHDQHQPWRQSDQDLPPLNPIILRYQPLHHLLLWAQMKSYRLPKLRLYFTPSIIQTWIGTRTVVLVQINARSAVVMINPML